jgi:methionine salvage enolase-phosphatase E1
MSIFISKKGKIKLLEQLCQAMGMYNALLAEELKSCQGIAWAHGWRSTEEKIKAGEDLRKQITLITQKLGWK